MPLVSCEAFQKAGTLNTQKGKSCSGGTGNDVRFLREIWGQSLCSMTSTGATRPQKDAQLAGVSENRISHLVAGLPARRGILTPQRRCAEARSVASERAVKLSCAQFPSSSGRKLSGTAKYLRFIADGQRRVICLGNALAAPMHVGRRHLEETM